MQAETKSLGAADAFAPEGIFQHVFLKHPRSIGESYWQHQRHALQFGTAMIAAGVACLIHGLVPALFLSTASRTIRRLHDKLVVTRRSGWIDPGLG